MRSYRVTRFGQPLEEAKAPTPEPQGTQVLIEVEGCGVCHSDVHLWDGYFDFGHGHKVPFGVGEKLLPITPGHEVAGKVVAVGPEAAGVAIGDHRVVYPWIGCGECPFCHSGREHLCSRPQSIGIDRDGGYADHVIVPHSRYLLDYAGVPDDFACTLACSGLTAYSALKKVGRLSAGESLLIIGAGGVGLAAIRLAELVTGAPPIVADIDAAKLEVAREAGAALTVNSTDPEASKQLFKATRGVVAAIDFVGSESSVQYGIRMLTKGGRLIIVGLFGGALTVGIPMLPFRSMSIVGSYVGSLTEMQELVALAREGKVKPIPLQRRSLDEAPKTLADLKAGQVTGRVVLVP